MLKVSCCSLFLLTVAACSSGGSGGGSGSGASTNAGGSGAMASSGHASSGTVGESAGASESGSSGAATAPAGAELTWDRNGTLIVPIAVEGILGTTSTDEDVEIVGAASGTDSLTMIIGGPPPLGGTYTCVVAPSTVELTYGADSVQSCSVTIALSAEGDGGQRAVGTFSAMLRSDGGAINLTNGMFDIPLQSEN